MATFKSNHGGARRNRKNGSTILRVAIFAGVLLGVFYLFQQMQEKKSPDLVSDEILSPMDRADNQEFYLPKNGRGVQVNHPYFVLSYLEEYEQAEWIAHVLTRERLEIDYVDRSNRFYADSLVPSGSATWYDYRGSGYDRGHLVPAADLAFSDEAMHSSFMMSNISPQSRDFNKGIWRELESQTRIWAKKYKKLYVVTGPVLSRPIKGRIGKNRVAVPEAFFKVILDASEPERKGIGFILPNSISYDPIFEYAVSIDSVEILTGLDFFPELLEGALEKKLEKNLNLDLWTFSKRNYDLRINKWNKE